MMRRLGFDVELNSLKSKEKIPFAASFDECQVNTFARFLNPVWKITEPLFNILHPWKNTFAQHLRTVDDFIYSVIEKRRDQLVKGATYHQDLLSRFMNARNEHGELLNDKVLRDIVSNFVLAGRDSTALVLSWTFYMLILHPRIEKKLLEEIYANVSDDVAKEPTALFEAIKSMTYAHAV
jgi:cytochrome P450